jgi:hypothetical protein
MKNYLPYLVILTAFASCKKRVEIREVPVDKVTSWVQSPSYSGTQRIILSSGRSADAIYLQQPFYFSEVRSLDEITIHASLLPTDISIRIPISPDIFAYPLNDSVLAIKNNKRSNITQGNGFYNLRQLDPSLRAIDKHFMSLFKCMAITNDKAVLVSYQNNLPAQPRTFFIFKMVTNNLAPYVDSVYTKKITIPRTTSAIIRSITAIGDYFLVDLSDEGIFKIRQDGTYSKVHTPAFVDAFYEWKGKIYGHAEQNKLIISDNNSESFLEFSGLPFEYTAAGFYVVKDSLVGAYRDNLYTFKWSGLNYSARLLKNDGLENTTINGIEILRDTVYVATTSGLYTKPASTFFEGKQ